MNQAPDNPASVSDPARNCFRGVCNHTTGLSGTDPCPEEENPDPRSSCRRRHHLPLSLPRRVRPPSLQDPLKSRVFTSVLSFTLARLRVSDLPPSSNSLNSVCLLCKGAPPFASTQHPHLTHSHHTSAHVLNRAGGSRVEVLYPPLTYLRPMRVKDANGNEQPKKPQVRCFCACGVSRPRPCSGSLLSKSIHRFWRTKRSSR